MSNSRVGEVCPRGEQTQGLADVLEHPIHAVRRLQDHHRTTPLGERGCELRTCRDLDQTAAWSILHTSNRGLFVFVHVFVVVGCTLLFATMVPASTRLSSMPAGDLSVDTTGRCRNRPLHMICSASKHDVPRGTQRGFCVITSPTRMLAADGNV